MGDIQWAASYVTLLSSRGLWAGDNDFKTSWSRWSLTGRIQTEKGIKLRMKHEEYYFSKARVIRKKLNVNWGMVREKEKPGHRSLFDRLWRAFKERRGWVSVLTDTPKCGLQCGGVILMMPPGQEWGFSWFPNYIRLQFALSRDTLSYKPICILLTKNNNQLCFFISETILYGLFKASNLQKLPFEGRRYVILFFINGRLENIYVLIRKSQRQGKGWRHKAWKG